MNQKPYSHSVPEAGKRPKPGFTVIELLVAMSVLVIIVLIVSLIFRRSSAVWDAGMNKAELDMMGRGVADYVAQEISAALPDNFSASAGAASFKVLGVASANPAISSVSYMYISGALTRNGTNLAEGLKNFEFSPAPVMLGGMPKYVDVIVTVTNEVVTNSLYQSRAYFLNRNRYKM